MSPLLGLWWRLNRATLGWMTLGMLFLTWLLAAPVAPMRDGIMKMVQETGLLQKMLGGMMGLTISGKFTLKLLLGSTWSHPILLLMMWGFAVAGATRFPAQESEQGSLDVLMSLPVSRSKALLAQTVGTGAGLVVLHLAALVGFALGCLPLGADAPTPGEMFPVACNLLATSLFVLALATLASCLSSRRMQAAGPLMVLALWSLLLGYLKPFLTLAQTLSPLGLLHYYRPGQVLQSVSFPWSDCLALGVAALVVWLLALWRLSKRDL